MSTWGDKLGRDSRSTLGVGYNVPPSKPIDLESMVYPEFHEGLDLSAAPEAVRIGASVFAIDMELSKSDHLSRSPGILQVSDETPHLLKFMFEQSSLDYITELVAIDPPWLGYKGYTTFSWVNLGLAATGIFGWNAVNYLGNLLFSNGVDASYSRASGAAVVTNQSANIIARTLAVQFGRKFAGFYTSGGASQSLGIKWDDTTATVGGWGGTGSGAELLLSSTGQADYVVALRPLGFDLLAILNRKSLWAGYKTGVSNRPADFRFRFGGVGCVHERSARVGPGCVTFLSDDGVVNYTVNSADMISGSINAELLPLDYSRLDRYVASYQAVGRRYILATPFCVWIYEYPIPELNRPGRWFKRSAVVDSIAAFTDQAGLITWDQLIGTWEEQSLAWDQIGQPGWAAPAIMYYGSDTLLGKEDPTIFTNFGTSLTPKWRTPQNLKVETTDQVVTHGFEIEYISTEDASVSMKTMDYAGDFNNTLTKILPSTSGEVKRRTIWGLSTGMGVQVQVEIASGSPQIARIRQIVERIGPSITAVIP